MFDCIASSTDRICHHSFQIKASASLSGEPRADCGPSHATTPYAEQPESRLSACQPQLQTSFRECLRATATVQVVLPRPDQEGHPKSSGQERRDLEHSELQALQLELQRLVEGNSTPDRRGPWRAGLRPEGSHLPVATSCTTRP